MTTVVPFSVRANRPDFIRLGADPAIDTISVDLDEIDADGRELLADYAAHDSGSEVVVSGPTTHHLLTALAARRAEEQKRDAERADYEARQRSEKIAAAHAVIAARTTIFSSTPLESPRLKAERKEIEAQAAAEGLTLPYRGWYDNHHSYAAVEPKWPWMASADRSLSVDDLIAGTDGAAWLAELDRENDTRAADAEAQLISAYRRVLDCARAQSADEAAGLTRLRDWGVESGSERVRLLIEESHPGWESVCADEFLDAHTPEGYAPAPTTIADINSSACPVNCTEVKDRTKPTAADIHALRAARALCAASPVAIPADPEQLIRTDDIRVLSEPDLAWVIRTATTGDDYESYEFDEKWAGVSIEVTAPNAATRTVWHRLTEHQPSATE